MDRRLAAPRSARSIKDRIGGNCIEFEFEFDEPGNDDGDDSPLVMGPPSRGEVRVDNGGSGNGTVRIGDDSGV